MVIIKNTIFILSAGVLWGIISIFVNQLQIIGFNSMEIVSLRVLFSSIILILYLLIADKGKLKIKIKDIPLFLGTGVCSIVFFNFCYFKSIELIGGSSIPALLLYTSPVFVMLISLFVFREKITSRKIFALILNFIGLIAITGAFSGNSSLSLKAFIFGLGSGLGYALYSIFGKFLVSKYESVTITVYTFITASVFSVPVSGIWAEKNIIFSFKSILLALLLALLCTVLPFLLYTKGLKHTDTGKASILATIEPFVASVVGVIVFNEEITFSKIIGMILIFAGIIVLSVNSKKSEREVN